MRPRRTGAILAVGGAEDKTGGGEILERFVAEAGGKDARIAIVPTASGVPDERGTFYKDVFTQIGVSEAYPVPIASREDAENPEHTDAIARATGIYLTGGDQSRLVSVLKGTTAFEALRGRLYAHCVIAGTSAGASAFSATMIVGGQTGLQLRKDAVRLAPGLGVIQRLIIDQHFSQRDRFGRLLTAVAMAPERVGVGIDEDTAILYSGTGVIEVLGTGQVFILDATSATTRGLENGHEGPFSVSGVVVHVMTAGERFNVLARRRLEPLAAAAD